MNLVADLIRSKAPSIFVNTTHPGKASTDPHKPRQPYFRYQPLLFR